jgi:hypothetical protein
MTLLDVVTGIFEAGSAIFGLLNIRAIRRDKAVRGVHWLPTTWFTLWGYWNLYYYFALTLPVSWVAGIWITIVNMVWLGHVFWYGRKANAKR